MLIFSSSGKNIVETQLKTLYPRPRKKVKSEKNVIRNISHIIFTTHSEDDQPPVYCRMPSKRRREINKLYHFSEEKKKEKNPFKQDLVVPTMSEVHTTMALFG